MYKNVVGFSCVSVARVSKATNFWNTPRMYRTALLLYITEILPVCYFLALCTTALAATPQHDHETEEGTADQHSG